MKWNVIHSKNEFSLCAEKEAPAYKGRKPNKFPTLVCKISSWEIVFLSVDDFNKLLV